jgi:hypothetical protein
VRFIVTGELMAGPQLQQNTPTNMANRSPDETQTSRLENQFHITHSMKKVTLELKIW